MKTLIVSIILVHIILDPDITLAQPNNSKQNVIPLEHFVGYYDVGTKPNKPFFKSRWYIKDGKLYTIYDSDKDRVFQPFEDGKLNPTVFINTENIQVADHDSTYYIALHFEENKLKRFKVIRPRSEWPTDLYGYRNEKLSELAIDTESILTLSHSTDHFNFFYSPLDSASIPILGQYLEKQYPGLIKRFDLSQLPKASIRIYPSMSIYHNAVLSPGAPGWQRGRAWNKHEIRMVSPIIVKENTGENIEINEVVLHEFVHCIHLNLIRNGTRVPGWLWEGLALYAGCCRWTENPKELDYMKKGKYPSLKKIERDQSYQMKYDLGYYIIEFIDKKYGWSNVLSLIATNGDIHKTLGISQRKFQKEFYSYLEDSY